MIIKIEKNIPVPTKKMAGIFPFEDMQVGDSFKVDSEQTHYKTVAGLRSAIAHYRPANFKIVTKLLSGDWRSSGTIRVWRVE